MINKKKPKYMQLKDVIKTWIISGRFSPGQQIPVEDDLAKMFNVSRHTVRQAVSELVYGKWLIREQGRGTFLPEKPFEERATQKSKVIAVIKTYISDYVSPHIVRGIETQLNVSGYSLLLLSTLNDFQKEAEALETSVNKKVDGIIVEPTNITQPNRNIQSYFSIIEQRIPIIMLSSSYAELGIPSVIMDNANGLALATQHLIDLGHKRIGGIFPYDSMPGKLRLRGFMQALHANNIHFNPHLLEIHKLQDRNLSVEKYANYIDALPASNKPTAIACFNDEIATLLIQQFKRLNIKVPEHISVIGFDNSHLAEANEVKLTTVKHPIFDMGVKAAELILQAIDNSESGASIYRNINDFMFSPDLVIRGSTMKPEV